MLIAPPLRALPVFRSVEGGAQFFERAHPPAETLRRVWPHLHRFGVTRLARQTDLDRVGIPTWAAFRPNAKSLASAQGKGLDDASACVSAAMEALEVAVAENPDCIARIASADELDAGKDSWFNPERLLPFGTSFDPSLEITWFLGEDMRTRLPIWVPGDAVDLDGERSELKGICKSTNGLASGNTRDEALFHALCELIERDATTLWSLAPLSAAGASCFAPDRLGDPSVDRLAAEIDRAGLRLRLFNQTSDLGIPVVMAVVGPKDGAGASELDVAAGYGAHPVAARAAIRAITEAAQSRITSIAASRDDIHSASFKGTATTSAQSLLDSAPGAEPPTDSTRNRSLPALISNVTSSLAARQCGVVAVDLVATTVPFHVVKVLSGDLEDRDANINWRPGWRSFDVLSPR